MGAFPISPGIPGGNSRSAILSLVYDIADMCASKWNLISYAETPLIK